MDYKMIKGNYEVHTVGMKYKLYMQNATEL